MCTITITASATCDSRHLGPGRPARRARRRTTTGRLRALAPAVVVALCWTAACGGGGPPTDGGLPDSALGADSGEILPDGGATTDCGVEGDMQQCDRATEICVESELGAGRTYQCEPLPDGCDADRTCGACSSVCASPADTCDDTGADNTLLCSCPQCV